ncbi:MAG TPA: cytochrome c oxidase subunit 3 family protein [Thermoanaerobaculia bacterium]|nr:cytochrome c oxidase subunit 3 family protein [Thermoanaerobaculia bacterium]
MSSSHHHHTALAHHFDSLEQQREASTFGMWVFLVTEIMFFGGLFTAYVIYRLAYPVAFAAASNSLLTWAGSVNTVVLICSSLTMAMAVRSAQVDKKKAIVVFLLLTILLGGVFLGIKAFEYYSEFKEHHYPGANFHFEGANPQHAQMFFSIYFCMTGLHALHMIIGMSILGVLLVQSYKGRFSSQYHNPLECMGLYWHFVDIVWIFLLPLLYLFGANLHHGG